VATIKTVGGKRDEYLKRMKVHSQRYLATEPGTLTFDIILPHDEADTIMLYELYASREAFDTHWHGPAKQQANPDFEMMRPPMPTVASGRCTSAPEFVESAIGRKPRLATVAVISTGRSRVIAACQATVVAASPSLRRSPLTSR
jgi:quinol monooxygenase YgiN